VFSPLDFVFEFRTACLVSPVAIFQSTQLILLFGSSACRGLGRDFWFPVYLFRFLVYLFRFPILYFGSASFSCCYFLSHSCLRWSHIDRAPELVSSFRSGLIRCRADHGRCFPSRPESGLRDSRAQSVPVADLSLWISSLAQKRFAVGRSD
jgi:hypothetical protein